jgi:hypothetical protein
MPLDTLRLAHLSALRNSKAVRQELFPTIAAELRTMLPLTEQYSLKLEDPLTYKVQRM